MREVQTACYVCPRQREPLGEEARVRLLALLILCERIPIKLQDWAAPRAGALLVTQGLLWEQGLLVLRVLG